MASIRELKTRIRSVKSTKQITKAMQLVAASKLRRAQEADQASAAYSRTARELLTYLSSQQEASGHPLFTVRPVKNRLLLVIASDKGLAGAYNSNVTKRFISELSDDKAAGVGTQTIAIGKRAAQAATRLKAVTILGVYENLPDQPSGSELRSVFETARRAYEDGNVDAVDIIYTQFKTSINQVVTVQRILPAGFETTTIVAPTITAAEFEPSPEAVLEAVTYRLVQSQIFQALLDAKASEHSMRMVAMKNATDNAGDLVDDLSLAMNKARQGAITQELAEISGGVEAMNE